MKTHTTLTLDEEVLRKVRILGLNVSGEVNEFLSMLVMKRTHNIEGINIELENKKAEKLQKKINKLQAELKESNMLIEKWEDMKQKKEEAELTKEKDRIEAAKKCINCGSYLGDKKKAPQKFTAGMVCHGCYMSGSGEDVKRWNKPKT